MTRRFAFATGLIGFLVAPMTGCFTSPINQPPLTPTITPTTPINHGGNASFTAAASDPDQDGLVVTWATKQGSCPDDSAVDLETWPGARAQVAPGESFTVGPELTGSLFCVCTFVTDTHNATVHQCVTEMPGNQDPVAMIVVKEPTAGEPFDLYSRIRLSAAGSLDPDGDRVTVESWSFASGTQAAQGGFVDCPADGGDISDGCFTADHQGEYVVQVTVGDGYGGRAMKSRTLRVAEDRIPCLGTSDPDWMTPAFSWPASQDLPFKILSVKDDMTDAAGNVLLTGSSERIHFTWYEGPLDGPLSYAGDDFPTFTRAANPGQLGQTRRVRVEIRDRNLEKISGYLQSCEDKDRCFDPARPDCVIRATWTVRYNL